MGEPGILPDDFDLDQLRITPPVPMPLSVTEGGPTGKANRRTWRQRYPEGFVFIPVVWLRALHRAPMVGFGGLYTACIVWHRYRMTQTMVITLPTSFVRRFGYARRNIQRGLKELEAAGLIQVDRRKGRLAQIWVLDEIRSGGDTLDAARENSHGGTRRTEDA